MKKVLFAGAASVAMMMAGSASAYEIYADAGTEGFGLGGTVPVTQMANIRGEVNGFALNHSFQSGGINYDGKLTLAHASIYADFFPAPSIVPFRVTAGLLLGNDNVKATATAMDGTFTINGVTVPADDQKINAKATLPHVRPYLGIGFGHTPDGTKGLSAFFDAGVAFGKPTINYDVPADLVAAVGPDNVAAEEKSFQDTANKLRFYPIVKVGLAFRF